MNEFQCPFCASTPEVYQDNPLDYLCNYSFNTDRESYRRAGALSLLHCMWCGWWELRSGVMKPRFEPNLSVGFHAKVHTIDISSNEVVLTDLEDHLTKRWSDRSNISAQVCEEIVRGVLKDHLGVDVEYFSGSTFAPDQGIDLAVGHSSGEVGIAVQVKRRIKKTVEPIGAVRDFIGAIALSSFKRGVFVTTAERFSPAARLAVESENLAAHRIQLALVDGERLLDLLRETVRKRELDLPPWIADDTRWYHWDATPHRTADIIGTVLPEDYVRSELARREQERARQAALSKIDQGLSSLLELLNKEDRSKEDAEEIDRIVNHLHETTESLDG